MRDIDKATLDEAILHQVEAGPYGLRRSGRELPFGQSPELAEFLAGHIRNGLKDWQTRAAGWSFSGPSHRSAGDMSGAARRHALPGARIAAARHRAARGHRRRPANYPARWPWPSTATPPLASRTAQRLCCPILPGEGCECALGGP
jgi:hypothetical protein